MIEYELAKQVTTDPFMLTGLGIIWLLPLLIWLVIGLAVKNKFGKYMITYPNFWYAVILWGFIQLTLIILYIFPIWLKYI